MLMVTKEFGFDSAHMLAGHDGLCKNVHGHTYKVEVTIASRNNGEMITSGPSEGMIVDFKHMKDLINGELFSKLDHAFIYNANSNSVEETAIVDVFQQHDMKLYAMQDRPTAENMALHFSEKIKRILIGYDTHIKVVRVKVWETPTSYAEVEE